jgi:hypothetical protein
VAGSVLNDFRLCTAALTPHHNPQDSEYCNSVLHLIAEDTTGAICTPLER